MLATVHIIVRKQLCGHVVAYARRTAGRLPTEAVALSRRRTPTPAAIDIPSAMPAYDPISRGLLTCSCPLSRVAISPSFATIACSSKTV